MENEVYISAVKAALLVMYGILPDRADDMIDDYGLREKIKEDPKFAEKYEPEEVAKMMMGE